MLLIEECKNHWIGKNEEQLGDEEKRNERGARHDSDFEAKDGTKHSRHAHGNRDTSEATTD